MDEWLGIARSLLVYWRPGWQRGLRRLYRPFVTPGDVVFDVGAHVGDRSAAFAALGARVVALEPQPRLRPWLDRVARRAARKGHGEIEVRPQAVGAAPGTASLAVSRRNPTLSTLSAHFRNEVARANPGFGSVRWEEEEEVEVTTLDLLREEYGPPAFVKIDVEGYEAQVLAGLSAPLPALSVEFVSGGLAVAEACVERLEALAPYSYNVIPGENRSFHLPQWRHGEEVVDWIRSGAGGFSSGDLYAVREESGRVR